MSGREILPQFGKPGPWAGVRPADAVVFLVLYIRGILTAGGAALPVPVTGGFNQPHRALNDADVRLLQDAMQVLLAATGALTTSEFSKLVDICVPPGVALPFVVVSPIPGNPPATWFLRDANGGDRFISALAVSKVLEFEVHSALRLRDAGTLLTPPLAAYREGPGGWLQGPSALSDAAIDITRVQRIVQQFRTHSELEKHRSDLVALLLGILSRFVQVAREPPTEAAVRRCLW